MAELSSITLFLPHHTSRSETEDVFHFLLGQRLAPLLLRYPRPNLRFQPLLHAARPSFVPPLISNLFFFSRTASRTAPALVSPVISAISAANFSVSVSVMCRLMAGSGSKGTLIPSEIRCLQDAYQV